MYIRITCSRRRFWLGVEVHARTCGVAAGTHVARWGRHSMTDVRGSGSRRRSGSASSGHRVHRGNGFKMRPRTEPLSPVVHGATLAVMISLTAVLVPMLLGVALLSIGTLFLLTEVPLLGLGYAVKLTQRCRSPSFPVCIGSIQRGLDGLSPRGPARPAAVRAAGLCFSCTADSLSASCSAAVSQGGQSIGPVRVGLPLEYPHCARLVPAICILHPRQRAGRAHF